MEQIAAERTVRRRESALQNNELELNMLWGRDGISGAPVGWLEMA
ncbi:MAG TPA: hypothetical protein VIG49_05805 [Acetobacteraceae bacterium]